MVICQMFVFGHIGFTWGGVVLLSGLPRWPVPFGSRLHRWGRRLPNAAIDYRFVIVGSVLPDLIDKPLGVMVLRDELGNVRTLGHSLLFVFLLLMASVGFRGGLRRALSLMAAGSAAHMVLDRLWMDTDTLFWPLLGWKRDSQNVSAWLEQSMDQLFSDPYTYVSEAIGGVVVAALLAFLLTNRGLREFVRTGRMARRSHEMPSSLDAGEERAQQVHGGQRAAERQ